MYLKIKLQQIKVYKQSKMNKNDIRQTCPGFRVNSSSIMGSSDFKSNSPSINRNFSTTQKSKNNPQDDIKTSNQNDLLIKMIGYDNGNCVKDCKAILDSIKDQTCQDKQKLYLFYQDDPLQIIQNLNLQHISLEKVFNQKLKKQISSKLKKIKLKKYQQTFKNYSKLMKYSLRQNQKIKYLTQTSKRHQSLQKHDSKNMTRTNYNKTHKTLKTIGSSMTVLDRIILQKRNQIAVQNSSKINKEQKDLSLVMQNRRTCQKILQQALMFQRYFDILKKEKNLLLEQKKQSSTSMSKQPINPQSVKDKTKLSKPHIKKLKNPNSIVKYHMKHNDLCVDPKHLRLTQNNHSLNKSKQYNYKTQQDFHRNKYMIKLKRDQYLKQINKVNQQIVQKRNHKNNVLIQNLLAFIRHNATANDQEDLQVKPKKKGSQSSQNKDQENDIRNTSKIVNPKVKQISGSGLTKILRKLFLIYSFMKSQQSSSQYQCMITKQSLLVFIKDFQIDLVFITKKNDKIKQIMQGQGVDQFQFIQFIHLLSTVHTVHYDHQSNNNELIYTNINQWMSNKILGKKYEQYLSLRQQRLIKKQLRKDVQKLRKLNRFQDKLIKIIDLFYQQQRVSKLMINNLFDDFDYVLQALWFIKIYPTYVNKRTIRFYFQYLILDKHCLFLNELGLIRKRKQLGILEVIIWFVIVKMSEQDYLIHKQQYRAHKQKISRDKYHKQEQIQEKSLNQIFAQKFKLILQTMSNIIQHKTNPKHSHQ